MRIIISGAAGRMGRAVAEQAEAAGLELAAGVDVAPLCAAFPTAGDFAALQDGIADAIIDFSRPDGLEGLLCYALRNGLPCVLATTGYTEAQLAAIDRAAAQIPVFRSANMSIGIALLRHLSRKAAEVLGDSFDVELVETPHNQKADAPSGTALMLSDAVKDAYDQPRTPVYGREGRSCRRTPAEIGIHALRGGTVAGEHEVCFFGPMERIRLSHSAENRTVFAVGAVKAARFLLGRAPGLYTMDDLIGAD